MDEIQDVIEEKFRRCPRCRSFSVKQSDELSIDEKIKSRFVPVQAFLCRNCDFRFVHIGKPDSISNKFFYFLFGEGERRKLVFMVVPLILLIGIIVSIFMMTGGPPNSSGIEEDKTQQAIQQPKENQTAGQTEEKPPIKQITGEQTKPENKPEVPPETKSETKPETKPEIKPEIKPEDKPEIPPETKPEEKPEDISPPVIYIELANSNRFGVNWRNVELGVQITRMSPGPLKSAGMKIGDIIMEVGDRKVRDGSLLLKIRNDIFRKRQEEALIKVQRNGKIIHFKLVKFKKKENSGNNSASLQNAETVIGPNGTKASKVFSRNSIKVRKSAPETESNRTRWCFLKMDFTISRTSAQRVLVAGNSAGTQNWAVDNQLVINGNTFSGVTDSSRITNGILPESVKVPPLDITNLVPPDKETVLKLQLIDQGRFWGNTDIFIVIR